MHAHIIIIIINNNNDDNNNNNNNNNNNTTTTTTTTTTTKEDGNYAFQGYNVTFNYYGVMYSRVILLSPMPCYEHGDIRELILPNIRNLKNSDQNKQYVEGGKQSEPSRSEKPDSLVKGDHSHAIPVMAL